jgi:hypothetical protein
MGIFFRHLLPIWNQLTAWPSLLKCKKMTTSLIQSFTAGRTILFSALSYNQPDWLTEFGATRTQPAIHQSTQFGAMKDSTRLHQHKYCQRSVPQARQLEAHASASSQARWGRTPFAQEQQWKCILLGYRFIQSCLLADGQAMHSYVISESKWSSSRGTLQNKCSRSGRFEQYRRLHHK